MPGEGCFVPDSYNTYQVDQYGKVSGEKAMMQEIYQRGPIACGIAVPAALENYTSGIFEDKTGDKNIVHDISIVGYGVENGVKYWTVRNSWGTHFGEQGFVRVIRGVNNIAIETDCAWATPKDTWTADERHKLTLQEKFEEPTVLRPAVEKKQKGACRVEKATFPSGEKRPPVHAGLKVLLLLLLIDSTFCLETRTQLQLVLMLRLLLTAMLEAAARVETQEVSTNSPTARVSQTLHASNMLPRTHLLIDAVLLTISRTAPGHHAQLERLAKTNAGLLSTRTTMPSTTTAFLENLK